VLLATVNPGRTTWGSGLQGLRELDARADAELAIDPGEVGLDGPDGDVELCRDLLVRATGGDEGGYPPLGLGEPVARG
jgi:hypothetical protein